MGIELELFTLGDVAVHYQCMVCKDIPEMSVSSLRIMCPSGHIVCYACVDPQQTRPTKCYLCSQSIGSHRTHGGNDWLHSPQPAIERLIKDLEVKCSKFAEGCQWKGKCNDLRTHEKTKCEHRIEACQHALRGCKFSDLPPKVLAHHLNCEYRDTVCSKRRPWDMKMCGTVHRVNQISKHDTTDCKYHVCAYSSSGCRFYGKARDVQEHQRLYCAPIHAKIAKLEAAVAEDTLIAEKMRLEKAVEKKVAHYKKRISTLEHDLKLAKGEQAVKNMQQAAGTPRVFGQESALPSSLSSSTGPNILLRMVSATRPINDLREQNDEASEIAWNQAHWGEIDWEQVDKQALQAAAKQAQVMSNVTGKALSDANAIQGNNGISGRIIRPLSK